MGHLPAASGRVGGCQDGRELSGAVRIRRERNRQRACTETDLLGINRNLLSAQTALHPHRSVRKALRQLAILLGKSGIYYANFQPYRQRNWFMNLMRTSAAAVIASSRPKSVDDPPYWRRASRATSRSRKLSAARPSDEQYAEIAALSLGSRRGAGSLPVCRNIRRHPD